MTNCRRKLKSQRGVTMIFALVIFLITVLFGMTMINGALTAAQNAGLQHVEEASYLGVTSAARLFCQQAPFRVDVSGPDPIADVFYQMKTEIDAEIDENPGTSKIERAKALTVKPPNGFETITVDLTMYPDHSVTATFRPETAAKRNLDYRVSVNFECKEDVDSAQWDVLGAERGRYQ